MDRIYDLLNNVEMALSQKTYDGKKRSDLKDSDFLFPETRSFPIVTPADVPDAISNFGRMKGQMSYDAFLKKLYTFIKKKGSDFVAALPDASKEKLGIKATILPVPTVNVEPAQDPNVKPPIKQEYVDKQTVNDSLNSQKEKVNKLKTNNVNEDVSRPNGDQSVAACKLKAGDKVKNINSACMHYGSEGIVERVEEIPENIGYIIGYKTTNAGQTWTVDQYLRKTEDQLTLIDSFDDYGLADDYMEKEEEEGEDPEEELNEYKEDFYEMSVGSLRAITQHAQNILDALDNPMVKENLTESWLQGKIAVTEDYMRTIHDFIMFVSDAADTISAADRPGLWENIRKKKEREGKKYKPAKPGDKDRPDPEQWKKLTKKK